MALTPLKQPVPKSHSSSEISTSSADRSGTPEIAEPRFLTSVALREWLANEGQPHFRADQILRWIYQRGAQSFSEMSDLPARVRDGLAAAFVLPRLTPDLVERSVDGTRKILFKLEQGRAIESVLIPDPPRLTLCISSQAGCGMGCEFCATAKLGFQRHLTATEIVAQVLAASAELSPGERISNIVFMGMGEPMHNYENVVEAISILTAEWGCGFSSRRITVSTVGLLPQLQRLVRETPVNVAISLTATTDELRDRIMPVNRKYPIETLIEVCRSLPIPQRRRITFEYILLHGVNDSIQDAARLIRLMHGIRAKVNLIPFNPFPGAGFTCPAPGEIRSFQKRLLAAGINATVRLSRGRDIQAACGQLAATSGGLLETG